MTDTTAHRSQILMTPWAGIYMVQTSSGHRFPKHWHDSYGLGLMESGAHRSASGRGQVEAFAGDVIACNPGEVHDGRPLGVEMRSWRMLSIEQPAMALATGAIACDSEIAHPVIRDPLVSRAVARLFHCVERWSAEQGTNSVEALACEEALVETCVLVMSRHATAPVAPDVPASELRLVRERLAAESMRPPSLGELAAMTRLSKFQLLRHFRRAYGLPPHAWLLRRRAERARALIRDGSSLASAAAQCGFSDQSHMTRVFVRQYGFTPGAWRGATHGRVQ